MARPGDTVHRVVRVQLADGTPVTGLTSAAVTVEAYQRAATASVWTSYSAALGWVEIGGGRYAISYLLPAAAGWHDVLLLPTNAAHTIFDARWSGEVEDTDLDRITGLVARPSAVVSAAAFLATQVPLELIAYRWASRTLTILDAAGEPLTTFGTDYPTASLRLAVRSLNQTTTVWDAGPSGTPAGFSISSSGAVLTITVPENATFFAALAAGALRTDLFWEVTADYQGVASQTVSVVPSSPLTLLRREVGT
jgi:hypothetical protein